MVNNRWVVDAPETHYTGKYLVDLTIWFGGTFIHSPRPKFVNGASILCRGLTGAHVSEEQLRSMCGNLGLHIIKGFYVLEKDGFLLLTSIEQYIKLFDNVRMHAKCLGGKNCKWKLHALKTKDDDSSFKVHSYYPIQRCDPTPSIKNVKSKWLADKFISKIGIDPTRKVKGLRAEIIQSLGGIQVSKQQDYRAKKAALEMLYGTPEEQVGLLWDYGGELLDKNPGSTVLVDVDGENKFEKFYCCLAACKEGFKHCRPIVGVDGFHLSGEYGGVLLTAIGIDPNNNTFPIAWAVVKNETFETWSWFLSLLGTDLGNSNDEQFTWMSDKQKGLCKAFETHYNEAANRFCVKHLHGNMKTAGFTGNAIKEALWNLANATTMGQYAIKMDEFEAISPEAAAWLSDKDPRGYCKAFFNTYPHCDWLLNHACESFNSTILDARTLGIISMNEWIMHYIMTRFQKLRDHCDSKWRGKKICPRIRKLLNERIMHNPGTYPVKASKDLWQVDSSTGDKYVVDLGKKTCGCRRWNLTGVPCSHAMTCLLAAELDPENYVHEAYYVKTYSKVYGNVVVPINGRKEWVRTGIVKPLPPNEGKAASRPKSARRRQSDEPNNKSKKKRGGRPTAMSKTNKYSLKRSQETVRCSYCKVLGHNRKGCAKRKEDEAEKETESADPNIVTVPISFAKEAEKQAGGSQSKKRKTTEVGASKTGGGKKSRVVNKGTTPIASSSKKPIEAPSMWNQMKDSGVVPPNYSKTINISGVKVHMKSSTKNQITSSQLEQIRVAKKNQKKKQKK